MKVHDLKAAERVKLARSQDRPVVDEYAEALFQELTLFSGDRCYGEDASVLGGVGLFHGRPVTVIGHRKGRDLEENLRFRFGMPDPEGYRKAERLMKQAAKFGRPVITLVDTPGAYPGKEAEERGQGQAIASCIRTMSRLPVPLIAAFVGEGGSGGALAFAVSDRTIMLENSIYSILSPEGFASILWHDGSRWEEASELMKLTAGELQELGICDEVLAEPTFGSEAAKEYLFDALDRAIWRNLEPLLKRSGEDLVRKRYRELGLLERRNGGN